MAQAPQETGRERFARIAQQELPEDDVRRPFSVTDLFTTLARIPGMQREVLTGAGKEALERIRALAGGASQLPLGIGMPPADFSGQRPGTPRPEELTPSSPLEKAGATGEKIAEFFIPGSLARRIPGLQSAVNARGMAGVGANALVEGLGAGTVSLGQTGDTRAAAFDAILDASVTAAFGTLGVITESGYRHSMNAAISPNRRAIAHGFDVDNVYKHGLQDNSVQKMAAKTKNKINELSAQLRDAIARHGDEKIDAVALLAEAVDDVRTGGASNFGKLADLERAQTKFMNELIQLNELAQLSDDGTMGIVEAQRLKQAVGEMGEWAEGVRDIDLRAVQALSNAYYSKLREALEIGAPEVIEINKALSEVLPINEALIARIPAELKSRLFELGELIFLSGGMGALLAGGDILGVGTGTAGLLVLTRMMRSPAGSRVMRRGTTILPPLGRGIGRVGAGIQLEDLERATAPQ